MAEKVKAASAGLPKEALHKHTQPAEVKEEKKTESTGLFRVKNLGNRTLYLANGTIPPLGEGFATQAEVSTLWEHIVKV